ncbi:2-oxo acid dehydrogenase subunit E2 [Svornostia abyssi]|uniref:Dihydrolipoamide acetyltransferase component of pyruvate dehydrogenase complex n=1 Tax=Svornostia abyssi TaxID=2898438 RepID=A0ABY5PE16_9ACTN|nr:2-oxo acid dehydrogenase subunit E2 [Parviterribacteraceae bacterium J379]
MGEFLMPTLGADMTEGKIVTWLVAPGDEVHHGDIVATVDTSKAEIDVEIFEDGVVEELLVGVGEKVPVGTPLARIAAVGAEPAVVVEAAPPAPVTVPETPAAAPPAPPARPAPPPPPTDGHRPRISPLARRVAADLGVDPEEIAGTGPHGSVVRADVERAAGTTPAPAPKPAPSPPAEPDRATAMRDAIGALMSRSKREIPHYHLALDIDLHLTQRWVTRRNEDLPLPQRLTPAGVLLAATARAAAHHSDMNGHHVDGAFHPADGVHLGVAISLRAGGLLTPAIKDADSLSVDELMERLRDVVHRARTGGLRASELAAPTLTVTDLGDRGVDLVHGVIYPPQVALVGFGAVRSRPWADGDALAVRPVVTATLAADHRVSDGHRGALFLREIDRLVQTPEEL